jgi:tetratricopeptide (TPR) repeat protein
VADRRHSEPEAEVEEALEQASPAAVALALSRTGKGSKALDADAQTFLREQTKFLKLQTEHLHEQRELQLAHLRVRRWKDRLAIALQALGVIAGVTVAVLLAAAAWDASRSHALVIEPFAVPPDLAQQGLSGPVAARRLQDELAALDRDTDSARAPLSYANNWADDIKVEIPETGLSIRDLEHILRDRLGHDTHITGEIVHVGDQITISVRTGDADAVSVSGPAGSANALLRQAAESVYRRTQPYRYSIWLYETAGKKDEARAFDLDLAATGSFEDRVWAYAELGVSASDPHEARRLVLQAAQLEPSLSHVWMDLSQENIALGREQDALDASRKDLVLAPRSEGVRITSTAARWEEAQSKVVIADELGDYAADMPTLAAMRGQPDYSFGHAWSPIHQAYAQIMLHEPGAARQALIALGGPGPVSHILRANGDVAMASPAAAVEDWSGAVADLEPYLAEATPDRAFFLPTISPQLAEAYAHTGRNADADRLLATVSADNYGGLRALGRVAAFRGDAAGSDRWFAAALKQGPSLPTAETDWGAALIARGRLDAGIAKLKSAHEKGPRFADPLELWGEALAAKRDYQGAVGKFREADRYAPRWGRNHLRWGEALTRLGRTRDARAQFDIARSLDLSAADRQRLDLVSGAVR